MRKKILLGLGVLASLSLIYLVVTVRKSPPPAVPPLPSPSPATLRLLRVYPGPGRQTLTFPNAAASFTFNQSVSASQIQVEVQPAFSVRTYTSRDGATFYVQPQTGWQLDTEYTITLQGLPIPAKINFIPVSPDKSGEIFDQVPAD